MDILDIMYKNSPIQKKWKPKCGDICSEGIVISYSSAHSYECYNFEATVDVQCTTGLSTKEFKIKDVFWKPKQEDLQNIYDKFIKYKKPYTPNKVFIKLLTDEYFSNKKYYDSISVQLRMDIAWCLFIHIEVYGLIWNWNNSEWVKV